MIIYRYSFPVFVILFFDLQPIPTGRNLLVQVGEAQNRATNNKTASRNAPLIEDRALSAAQRHFVPRILSKGGTQGPVSVGTVLPSGETFIALDRAVSEATDRLRKADAEAANVKKQVNLSILNHHGVRYHVLVFLIYSVLLHSRCR